MLRLKLMIWDHNRGMLFQRAKVVYDDPAAARYVWGAGFHWYVGDHFDNPRQVHDAWPDKQLLFTEGTPSNFDAATLGDWKWGEIYATSILNDVNNWANGWTDWNVLLDERGGPNHVGNFCIAPVHGDTRSGELTYTSSLLLHRPRLEVRTARRAPDRLHLERRRPARERLRPSRRPYRHGRPEQDRHREGRPAVDGGPRGEGAESGPLDPHARDQGSRVVALVLLLTRPYRFARAEAGGQRLFAPRTTGQARIRPISPGPEPCAARAGGSE